MMWLRRLAWFVLAVLVLMGAAWLGLSGALKPHGGQRLSALLGRAASIERVKRKPWLLMLTVRQLQFAGLGKSATPLLRAERPYVNADARSLTRIAPVIEAREVDAPQVHVSRLAASRCDIDDVFTRLQLQSKKTQPSEPLNDLNTEAVTIGSMKLTQSQISVMRDAQAAWSLRVQLAFSTDWLPIDHDMQDSSCCLTIKPRQLFTRAHHDPIA